MDADAHEPSDRQAHDEVVDLSGNAAPFSTAHVLRWLRTSGGSLYERSMKRAAAQLLEASLPAPPTEVPGPLSR